jgi:hypothetical protein
MPVRCMPWLDASTSRRLTTCLSRRIGWRRPQRCDFGQDLQHDRPRYYTGNTPNVRVANTSHPRADGSTLAVEPSPRMPLGMPRQHHMVIGQRLGHTAGPAITSSGAVEVIWSLGVTITTGRSLGIPLASAISAQTMRPSWRDPGIPVPCVPSERLRLVPFKPLRGRRGNLGHLRPIDLGRALLGVLLR